MKAGARAVGVAESYTGDWSTLAGAVVRADRVVDGLVFSSCRVGGTDATQAIVGLVSSLDRADVQYVLIAGIAPAWYNLVDLPTVAAETDRPALSVSFEDSTGLEANLRESFDGPGLEDRLATYRRQPARERLRVNEESVYVRSSGLDDEEARDVIRAFTPEGGRPEPLRVARLAARAADRWRQEH